MCGEAVSWLRDRVIVEGLSPRVRGSRQQQDQPDRSDGSIPACAGKPRVPRSSSWSGWVYPRVCGEAHRVSQQLLIVEGLSPRVRGSLRTMPSTPVMRGSIPACAGKPSACSCTLGQDWVYPRVCGEASYNRDTTNLGQGSIPACAGKPRRLAARTCLRRVYPRVCGEADYAVSLFDCCQGLSPRVRGSHGNDVSMGS